MTDMYSTWGGILMVLYRYVCASHCCLYGYGSLCAYALVTMVTACDLDLVQNTAIDLNDPDLRQLFERMNMNVNQFSKDDLGFVNEFVKQRGGMDAVRNDNKRYGRPLPPPPGELYMLL